MGRSAPYPSLYAALEALPEGLTGEILAGQLHTQPHPSGLHASAASRLGMLIGGPYDRGLRGPGGWRILIEPEVHFVRDAEVAVPDLAGWRSERMAQLPRDQRFEVIPDWICEILSPSTRSKDREIKLPLYARHGVRHVWLLDPGAQTLEVCLLDAGEWARLATFHATEMVATAPFEAAAFRLDELWS